jgi:hypothetical protein
MRGGHGSRTLATHASTAFPGFWRPVDAGEGGC